MEEGQPGADRLSTKLQAKAVEAIERDGILLVYPIKNEREPPSLWTRLWPRTAMRWDWAETADDRVVDLWHVKTVLSESRDVVYAKWYKSRATFFSRPVFAAMVRILRGPELALDALGEDARRLYELLLEDSPQSTKTLRAALGLEGKLYEGAYNRAQKPLWSRLLLVGFGEVDEGSFPSLAIGATKVMFEELWEEALELTQEEAWERVLAVQPEDSLFVKQLRRISRP